VAARLEGEVPARLTLAPQGARLTFAPGGALPQTLTLQLTKRAIDQATYHGPGGCYLWDAELRGFGLRIYPSGRKSFLLTYSHKGRQRFFTLGRFGELTLQEARAEALDLLGRIRKGEDPAGAKSTDRTAPTMAMLADRHIKEHAEIKNKARSAERDRRAWDRCILPTLGQRKVKDITRADIAKLLMDMAETPAMANKVGTLLSKAFNLAEVWGWRPEGSNPCRHVDRYQEDGRERYLADSELRRLGQVLDKAEREWETDPRALVAIRLLIFTGCRSAEILGLRWQEVDIERRCLHLPDSKTGKRTILLNSAAVAILEGLKRAKGEVFVIPGDKPGTHRSSLQPAED